MYGVVITFLLLVPRFYDACPNKCLCRDFRTLCTYSRIKSLPRGISLSTEFLRMEGDNLIELNSSIIKDSGLTRLKTMILIKTHIQKVKRLTFSHMKELEYINFSENNITELETDTFKGLDMLYLIDLSDNRITDLSSGVFNGLKNLRHLNLSFNLIKNLHSGVFNGLRQKSHYESQNTPMKIDISGNPISQIAPKAFRGLGSISQLRFESYHIEIKSHTFLGLNKLTRLVIVDKGIGQPLYKNALRGLNNLKHIHMTGFVLRKLPAKVLEDSRYLKSLSLPRNGIEKLETQEFWGLKSLSELNLEENHLSYLNNFVFQYLESLTSLNLRKNWIGKIQLQAFKGLKSLRYLDFSNNALRFLNSSFLHLPMLRQLNLKDNFIELVEAGFFSGLPSLKSLDLSGRYTTDYINETFLTLWRLDSLKYSGQNSLEGIQVLKSLQVHLNAESFELKDDISYLLQKMLKFPHYIQEPIIIKVSHMKAITLSEPLSKFNISTLDLSPSNIRVLRKHSFVRASIFKSLILRRCQIKSIEQGAFHGLGTLSYLDLSENSDLSLEADMFMGLHSLAKLNLRNNSMTSVKVGVLKGLSNLKKLILQENEIKRINPEAFRGLNALVSLLMRDNKIKSILPNTFKEIRGVQKLDLSGNKISTINAGVFGAICPMNFNATCKNLTKLDDYCNTTFALKQLKYLDLSYNEIKQINSHAFLSCNKLQTLLFDGNSMLTLDAEFLLLPGLRKVDLKFCNISQVPNTIFQCTSQLSEIEIYGNNIKNFKVAVLQPLMSLRRIHLPDINCNCDFYEVWQWLLNRQSQIEIENQKHVCDIGGSELNIDIVYSALECNVSSYNPSAESKSASDYFLHFKLYIEPIILIGIFISGFSGNALLLYTIVNHSEMRTKQNVCIVHLTIADMTALTINLPLSYWDVIHGTWELDLTTCRLFLMSKDLTVVLVVYSVVALCIERFMIVRTSYNLKSGCRIYESQPTLFIVIIWIYATVTTLPVYFTATVEDRCLFCTPGNDNYIQRIWTFQFFMYCLMPAVTIIVLNTMTTYTLRKSVRKMPGEISNNIKARNRINVGNIVIILALLFSISYFPNFFLRMYVSYTVNELENIFIASFVTYCLFFSHTIFNPIAIFIMGSKFRFYILKYVRYISGIKGNEHILNAVEKSRHPHKSQPAALTITSRIASKYGQTNETSDSRVSNDSDANVQMIRQARMERLAKLQKRFY